MKTVIIGAGAVGSYFGGQMLKSGLDVTLLARDAHYTALSTEGLTVKTVEGSFHLHDVPVVSAIPDIYRPELVLIFVKTISTQQVTVELREVLQPSTLVITFQTGLDNDLQWQKALRHPLVFPGLAYINAQRTAPGFVEQISGPGSLIFGSRPSQQDNERLQDVLHLLQQAHLNIELAADIVQEMWIKLIWISAFAGLTAVYRSAVAPILNDAVGLDLFRQCLLEAQTIARASNICLPEELDQRLWDRIAFYREQDHQVKTSLLLDMESGRLTEVETIHGALVRHARAAGVETPALDLIYSVINLYNTSIANNG